MENLKVNWKGHNSLWNVFAGTYITIIIAGIIYRLIVT